MQVYFDGAGLKAEQLVADQFEAKLTSKKTDQYKDIDAFVTAKNGSTYSVSVKDQLKSSHTYGAIQIEWQLVNTRNNNTIPGCFQKCEASYYFWRVWTEEHGDTWAILPVAKMKAYVNEHRKSLKKWYTREGTEAKNRSYGRTYDRSCGYVIPLADLLEMSSLKPVTGTKQ